MAQGTAWTVACTLLLVGNTALAQTRDRVKLVNVGTDEKAILVDGRRGTQHVNDEVFFGLDVGSFFAALFPSIVLDNFTSSTQSNEVIGFARGRAPTLVENVTWTMGSNTVTLEFADEYRIPVFVWILGRPFDERRQRAVNASVGVSRIWREERQGVSFERFEIRNASTNSSTPEFLDFDCTLAEAMRQEIGLDPRGINVYYVDTVVFDGTPSLNAGVWCGTATIAMGRNTTDHLLAHEIGHAFNLDHVNDNTFFFDTTNVMHNESDDRQYFTEGQTFRAVHSPFSALNNIYDVRQGQPTRFCPHSVTVADRLCPAVQKRVWDDGVKWPARSVAADPSSPARANLERFLVADCEVGENHSAVERMLPYGEFFEEELLSLLSNGPDDAMMTRIRSSLEDQWKRREAFLSTHPDLGLGAEETNIALGRSKSDHVEEGAERFARRCDERAVIGLAAIGSPEALEALREVEERGDEQTAQLVRAALQRYQGIRPDRPGRKERRPRQPVGYRPPREQR